MPLTIADRRVDAMQNALTFVVQALDRWKIVERELAEARKALDAAAAAIYDATLYDPEGEREDA